MFQLLGLLTSKIAMSSNIFYALCEPKSCYYLSDLPAYFTQGSNSVSGYFTKLIFLWEYAFLVALQAAIILLRRHMWSMINNRSCCNFDGVE